MLLVLQDDIGRRLLFKPSFLQTVLKDIVLAGKSMELLSSLGQKVDILRGMSMSVACYHVSHNS